MAVKNRMALLLHILLMAMLKLGHPIASFVGNVCGGTMVEHLPHNPEVVLMNPAGSWAFVITLILSQNCAIKQVPRRETALLIFFINWMLISCRLRHNKQVKKSLLR